MLLFCYHGTTTIDAQTITISQRRAVKRGFARVRHFAGAGMIFLGVGMDSAVLAAPLQLPPLLSPASDEHHVGKVILTELVTPDLEASKHFYGELFGWTYVDVKADGVEYAQASLEGRPVAGLFHRNVASGEHKQPTWLTFISVRDVDSAKTVAIQNGAKELFAPHTIPGRGREAVFADPQGAVFAVLASSSGDPPDVLVSPGEWIWSSLITSDTETGAAFYQTLFDYEVFELPAEAGSQHLILAADNFARISANTLPAHGHPAHPHWLNFVRVDDATSTAAKVVALGGKVLVEPRADRHGGKIAVVADPLGAPFGLMEWRAADNDEAAQ